MASATDLSPARDESGAGATEGPATSSAQRDVFISYARVDSIFVDQLRHALANAKITCWIDTTDIPGGLRWGDEIRAGILGAANIVFVISPASVASQNCRTELDFASQHHKRCLPVLWQMTPQDQIPGVLQERDYVSFVEPGSFEAALAELVL